MQNIDNVIRVIQKSTRTIFILCGFPYAGKSYIAKEIQRSTDIAYVAIDDVFHRQGFNWNTNTLPNSDEWQKIFDESYEMVKAVLKRGDNVLYDSTNQTRASRDKLREVAHSVGAETTVIYIQSSPETVGKRWEENQKNPNRSVVSWNLVQMTIDQFEAPAQDENVITILND